MINSKDNTVQGTPAPAPIPSTHSHSHRTTDDQGIMEWLTPDVPGTDASLQSFLDSPLFDGSPLFGDCDSFDIEETPMMPTPQLDSFEGEQGLFTMGPEPDIYASPALLDYSSFEQTSGVGVADIPLMGSSTGIQFPLMKEGPMGDFWHLPVIDEAASAPAVPTNGAIAPHAVHLRSVSTSAAASASRPQPHPVQRTAASHNNAQQQPQSEPALSRKQWTGTRPNITPQKLIPVDAPVQSRSYIMPSATSRKEVPNAFAQRVARKRNASVAFTDDGDDVEDEGTQRGQAVVGKDKEVHLHRQIEAKRLQNTKAARRSRARKLEYQRQLEDDNTRMREELDAQRERIEELERMLGM